MTSKQLRRKRAQRYKRTVNTRCTDCDTLINPTRTRCRACHLKRISPTPRSCTVCGVLLPRDSWRKNAKRCVRCYHNHIRKPKKLCPDCSTPIKRTANRCRACSFKVIARTPNHCVDCHALLNTHRKGQSRCRPCFNKYRTGPSKICPDCGHVVKRSSAKCRACFNQHRAENYQGIRNCLDCGKSIGKRQSSQGVKRCMSCSHIQRREFADIGAEEMSPIRSYWEQLFMYHYNIRWNDVPKALKKVCIEYYKVRKDLRTHFNNKILARG